MARVRGDHKTLDLLNWRPPEVAVRFEEDEKVRAATVDQRISRAVSLILKESKIPRETITQRMSEYLGKRVSKNMLDACASQARQTHNLSLAWALALLHATDDARILGLELDRFELAIIPKRYLDAVEESMWADQEERAHQHRVAARRRWKGAGS